MRVLLISTDLMISSMLEGAARPAAAELTVARAAEASARATEESPTLVVIDLASVDDVTGLVAELRAAAPGAKLLAFGPHVHKLKLEQAQQAGCDHVMSRGQFHHSAGQILAELATAR